MTEPVIGFITFKPGDVVELKSGGPAMTVLAVKEDGVHCLWYAEMSDEVKTAVIPPVCLDHAEAELLDEEDADEEDEEDEDEDEEDQEDEEDDMAKKRRKDKKGRYDD